MNRVTQAAAGCWIALMMGLPPTTQATPFRIYTIDQGVYELNNHQEYGLWTSIAVTDEGRALVAHTQIPVNTLRLSDAPAGSAWDYLWPNVRLKSLQLDDQGQPYLAFARSECINSICNPRVYVQHPPPDTVFSTPNPANAPSLKIDANGKGHVAYIQETADGTRHDLYYATDVSGTWVETPVMLDIQPQNLGALGRVALALSPTGDPHIAFIHDDFDVWYAEATPSWSSELVAASVNAENISMAVDAADTPHISFAHGSLTDVMHATKTGGSWTVSTVYTPANPDHLSSVYTSIALDSQGIPHISFNDPVYPNNPGPSSFTDRLFHAYLPGASWVTELVDSTRGAGRFNSIAIDNYDNIHISYSILENFLGSPTSSLRYASAVDCNDNGIHDSNDIENATSQDCNNNAVPDECDIARGTSGDCDGNGIPDECETWEDCNNNGINDLCDIEGGIVSDCNANEIPDSCDVANGAADCDNNGIQDLCDFGTHLVISGPGGAYDEFGTSLARGDINGDGLEDLIVGGPYSGSSRDEGRVYVYYGGTPMDDVADLVLAGSTTGADLHFGFDVACGDVNNDNYDDVIVGAPLGSTIFNPHRGFVYVFLGGTSPSTTYSTRLEGSYEEHTGHAVACADINGDNYDDVIVGSSPEIGFGSMPRVRIYLGNALGSGPYQTFLGENYTDLFGFSVDAAGDVDNNGIQDLLIGAPEYNLGDGKAYLHLGNLASTMTPGPTFTEPGNLRRFGTSFSGGSDVNNDGFDDLHITDEGGKNLWSYFGSAVPDGVVDFFVEHVTNSGASGPWHSLSSLADVNGDGISDVILGTPSDKGATAESFQGTARVFLGGAAIDTSHVRLLAGEDSFQGFLGGAVLGFDDMNGDGLDEFVIGEPGYGDTQGRVHVLDMLHAQVCSQIGVPRTLETQIALRAHPSPFSHSTSLVFSLSEPGDVSLQVFDAAGRLVSEFARAPYPAGTSQVVWDGSSRGHSLPSGVYFARLLFGTKAVSTKIVLLR